MADITYVAAGGAVKVLKDLGDGTWAELVALAATPTIDIGDVSLLAGTAIVGKVGIDQTTPGTTNAVVANAAAVSGGIPSTSRLLSAAASTNGTNVKASAGRMYAIQGYNAAAAVRWIKLYNKATTPTVGTDTPVKTFAIPATSVFAFDWPLGYSFATGIGFGLTTGSADNDTGALTAGDILGLNIDYA